MTSLPSPHAVVEGISEYRLPNGLRVLLFPDPSTATVTVNITYLVGSRHEAMGQSGLAHLLEHLQFKGTPRYPQVAQTIRDWGGNFNGTTSVDRTNYYATLPAGLDSLQRILALEADRMRHSRLAPEDLATERDVVLNELDQGENQPFRLLYQRTMATAFSWHGYGRATIGNRSDVANLSLEAIRQFYDCYYQPDNAVLVVTGAIEPEAAWAAIEATFGQIPRPTRTLPSLPTVEPPQDGLRQVTVHRVGEVPLMIVVYHIPSAADPQWPVLELAARVLAARPSGRLYRQFVETRRTASVSASATNRHDPGHFFMAAAIEPQQDVETLPRDMVRAVEALAAGGPTEEELERAKQQLLQEWEDDFLDSESVAVELSEWIATGDWRLLFLERDGWLAATAADVQAVAERYLIEANATIGRFVPVKEREPVVIPPRPDLVERVGSYVGSETWSSGEDFAPTWENLAQRTLIERPSGERWQMALLPKRTRGQQVMLSCRLQFGSPDRLSGRETAADLLERMLGRGAGDLDYPQVRDRLTACRAALRAESRGGRLELVVQTRRPFLRATCELLSLILRRPRFLPAEFAVVQQQTLMGIQSRMSDPQAVAAREYQRRVWPYPPGDVRWVPTWAEELALVQAATCDDVADYYATMVQPQSVQWGAVGDFDPQELREQCLEIMADWPVAGRFERITREVQPIERQEVVLAVEDKPNAAFFAGGALPVLADDPVAPALVIANEILGGSGLSSRLGQRIRQQEGMSYTVASSLRLASFSPASPFTIYAIAAPENRGKLWSAVAEVMQQWLQAGPTEDEVQRTKLAFLQAAQRRRTDDFRVLNTLLELLDRGRAFEDYAVEEQSIGGLEAEDIAAASRQFWDPERWVYVTAGSFGVRG